MLRRAGRSGSSALEGRGDRRSARSAALRGFGKAAVQGGAIAQTALPRMTSRASAAVGATVRCGVLVRCDARRTVRRPGAGLAKRAGQHSNRQFRAAAVVGTGAVSQSNCSRAACSRSATDEAILTVWERASELGVQRNSRGSYSLDGFGLRLAAAAETCGDAGRCIERCLMS